jgi:hypothetical protein
VEDEHRADELAEAELRADEGQPTPVGEERAERHAAFPPRIGSIYCRERRDREERAILSKDRFQRLAEELLSNPRFAQVLMSAVQAGLETKGHIDRNMQTVLGLLNLPSRADVNKLATKLELLQGSLTNLNLKVDKLVAAERRRKRARKMGADASEPE